MSSLVQLMYVFYHCLEFLYLKQVYAPPPLYLRDLVFKAVFNLKLIHENKHKFWDHVFIE